MMPSLATISSLLLLVISGYDAAVASGVSVIQVEMPWSTNGRSFTGETKSSAMVSIQDNDLFRMPSLVFEGLREKIEFTKANALHRKGRTIWHGSWIVHNNSSTASTPFAAVQGGVGFATLYSTNPNSITGTITTPLGAYTISTAANSEQHRITFTKWNDFPPEADPLEEEEDRGYNLRRANRDESLLYQVKSAVVQRGNDDAGTWETESGPAALLPVRPSNLRLGDDRGLQFEEPPTVDLMIVVTNRAACENVDLSANCTITQDVQDAMNAKLYVALADTNEGMEKTGAFAKIRLAATIYLGPETWDISTDPKDLRAIHKSDQMEQWRNEHGADLVSVIAAGGPYCGSAFLINWPSIIAFRCLPYYSFSHELGHCLGCHHNQEDSSRNDSFAHGYQSTNHEYRTFLSYNCRDRDCPRIPYYSTPDYQLPDGRPLGTSSNDNARQITDSASAISLWKNSTFEGTNPPVQRTTTAAPTFAQESIVSPTPKESSDNSCSNECPDGSNAMYRTRLFGLICMSRCVPEERYVDNARSGWSCNECSGLFDFATRY